MTGIEKLRALARRKNFLEPAEAREIDAIADQIEREHAEDCIRMGERAEAEQALCVEMGAPLDEGADPLDVLRRYVGCLTDTIENLRLELGEARDAIAWVREHGGLGAVKDEWNNRRTVKQQLENAQSKVERQQRHIESIQSKLAERRDRIADLECEWDELRTQVDAMRPRLMPEGMEWPRFEDGEPVHVGDVAVLADNEPHEVESMEFFADKSCKLKGKGTPWMNTLFKGQVAKRTAPKVLDADGVEVEVGDDLYSVEGSLKFHVSHIDRTNGKIATDAMFALDKWADPKMYTHRAPVLAADGRLLREGEHVWHVETGTELVVKELPKPGEYQAVVVFAPPASHLTSFDPDQLTHERPESKCRDCKYWQKDPTADNMGVCWFYYHEHEGQDCYAARLADIGACEEFMRRAKALAERGA